MKNKQYTLALRLIHWLIAISILLLLITIFLRMTWLNKNHLADIISGYLSVNNQSLSYDDIIILAKQIRKPMWIWHLYIGYFLIGLFITRIVLSFSGIAKIQNPTVKNLMIKERFQYWVYIAFYVFVFLSLVTGMLIVFGPDTLKKQVEFIHKLSIYYLIVYIVLHIGGILIAEFTSQKGIISWMVSGKSDNDS